MKLKDIRAVHMIGVGGSGMSALARFYLNEKKLVSGSDMVDSPNLQALKREGALVSVGHAEEHLPKDVDLVVYSEAVQEDNPELALAKKKKIPTLNYFGALGMVANEYYLIAVSGTHGKTTTTAMLIDIFEHAGKDPTGIVGSLRAKTKSNFRAGKSKYAIVEACEYKRDFLSLTPDVLVITNIEHDHADYYKNLGEVQEAFGELVGQVHESGAIVADSTNPAISPILSDLPEDARVVDYTKNVDLALKLKLPGIHNRLNAAVAATVARLEGIDEKVIKEALEEFSGTWRRFEYKGELNGAPVYDDYAHHPTEIKATIAGARELYPHARIVAVFEPHTFSRTKAFFKEFAAAFKGVDAVIFLPVYAAREENTLKVSSKELSVAAIEHCRESLYATSYDDAEMILRKNVTSSDVVLILGAGSVTELAQRLSTSA